MRRLPGVTIALALALALASSGALSGCASQKRAPGPGAKLSSFVADWASEDWSAMKDLCFDPPPDFVAISSEAFADLHVTRARFKASLPVTAGEFATAKVEESLALAYLPALTISTVIRLVDRSGRWFIDWSPSTIDPALKEGDSFAVTYTWPKRAAIEGSGGVLLSDEQPPMVIVGIQGSFVRDAKTLTDDLVVDGAPLAAIRSALELAAANPTAFEPVFEITAERYAQLKPTIYPLPGTVFRLTGGNLPAAALAPLIGSLGQITPAELRQWGLPYDSSSVVGLSGLELAYQRQLAGTPGGVVRITDGSGIVATLATFPARAGRPVITSIVPAIEQAAEAALAGEGEEAALIAVNASTGQIEADVNHESGSFDLALDGEQPPGSTFKVITSTALFDLGLKPTSPATCPSTIDVGGEILHNAGNEAPVSDVLQAFSESCNTAFIGLALANLAASSLHNAAAQYDLGVTPDIGVPAFGGSAPIDVDATALAESAIGQAQVVVSPLDLAMIASDLDSGTVRQPRLVQGAPPVDESPTTGESPPKKVPPTIDTYLHEMMLSVVQSGTAAGTGLPAGTYAKTGTAEYGSGNPLPVDAWLMGWNGDTAFAMVVINAPGNGGPIDGPIVARFLDAIGA